MTDYRKWDKFCAEIDSDSDGMDEIGSQAQPQPPPPERIREIAPGTAAASSSKLDQQPRLLADTGGSTLELNLMAQKVAEALEVEEKALEVLKAKRQECLETQDALSYLPCKTRHKVMVPCGGSGLGHQGSKSLLAFQEGELVHTNEVLVKLDDDVCVERTAAQARDMLERKAALLDGQIREAETSLQSLRNTLSFTSDATQENFIDIREEYESSSSSSESEEESEGKDRNKTSSIQQTKRERPLVTDEEFEEMLRKLDKFEKLELESEERSASSIQQKQKQEQQSTSTSTSKEAEREKRDMRSKPVDQKNQTQKRINAFSGKVLEKSPNNKANESGGEEESKRNSSKSNRPVSRFKMSLQK